MRDPDGSVEFQGHRVVRRVDPAAAALPFLRSAAGRALTADRLLVDYAFVDDGTLESPQFPFVSYPYEWCAPQLRAAAALTLELSQRILAAGQELKDASAWNVIFAGCKPLFCDLLSPQPIRRRQWWALGQYARHFVLPLALDRRGLVASHQVFRIGADGIDPRQAAAMLGIRRYLSRTWPLMLRRHQGRGLPADTDLVAPAVDSSYHRRLYEYLDFALGRDDPRRQTSEWSDYTGQRAHYVDAGLNAKRRLVETWMRDIRPSWVLDLGCNTGEFSVMASAGGAQVVAVDKDAECVSRLFLSCRGSESIHPVVADVSDLVGGTGFGGREYPGLGDRLHQKVDCVLALAVLHHLFIGAGVHLATIASLLHDISRDYLIIELVPEDDPLANALARQRGVSIAGRGCAFQLSAFAPYFTSLRREVLPGNGRELHLLQRLPRGAAPPHVPGPAISPHR